jgi:methionyl-tRNA formyltransferase
MRVVFAGTPEFARVALERLHASGFEIPLVLTQPDRPAGRGMKLQPSPVKQFAQAHGIPVAQPRSLRLDGKAPEEAQLARGALHEVRPDVIVVAAYGLILPTWVLDLPRLGCINIHASLLPRWRGAAPIHRAIEGGDRETGVTIMQMDAGLDTGDMLLAERVPIEPSDTTGTLHDRLAALGGRLVVQALEGAAAGTLQRTPQPAEGVTYAHKIDKDEAAIDWRQTAELLERRIRAFDPFPGASARIHSETVKVWAANAVMQGRGSVETGTIVAIDQHGIGVACGQGRLEITELQRAGGKRMGTPEFLRGFPLAPGARFEPRD